MTGKQLYLLTALLATIALLCWLRWPREEDRADRIRQLTSQAASGDPVERLRAVEQLVKLGAEAVPSFGQLLRHPDGRVRALALMGIGRLGAAAVSLVPAVRSQLKARDRKVRQEAIVALGRIVPARLPHFPEVAAALDDEDPGVRTAAVRALAGGGQAASRLLIAALERQDRQLQVAALHTLARLGHDAAEAVPTMARFVHHPHPLLRYTAFCALGRVGTPAVPVLARVLAEGPGEELRTGAAVGLALAGSEAAAAWEQLVGAVDEAPENAALVAGLALARCASVRPDATGAADLLQTVALEKRRTVRAPSAAVCDEAWKLLMGIHGSDWYSALTFLAFSRRVELDRRPGAVIALAACAPDSAASLRVAEAAVHGDETLMRRAGSLALARLARSQAEARDVLETLVRDRDVVVRSVAQRTLQRVQAEEFNAYISRAAVSETSGR